MRLPHCETAVATVAPSHWRARIDEVNRIYLGLDDSADRRMRDVAGAHDITGTATGRCTLWEWNRRCRRAHRGPGISRGGEEWRPPGVVGGVGLHPRLRSRCRSDAARGDGKARARDALLSLARHASDCERRAGPEQRASGRRAASAWPLDAYR